MKTKNATTNENVNATTVASANRTKVDFIKSDFLREKQTANNESLNAKKQVSNLTSANDDLLKSYLEVATADYKSSKSFAPNSVVLIYTTENKQNGVITYKCFNFVRNIKSNDETEIIRGLFLSVIQYSRSIAAKKEIMLKKPLSYKDSEGKQRTAETLGDTGLIKNVINRYLDTCTIYKTNDRGYVRKAIIGNRNIKESILKRCTNNKYIMLSDLSNVEANIPLLVNEFLSFYQIKSILLDGTEQLTKEGAVQNGKKLVKEVSTSVTEKSENKTAV